MAEVLRPTNFDAVNIAEVSELSADVAAGQKIANVISGQGYAPDDFYILGGPATEYAELAQLDSKNVNKLTAKDNYAMAHRRGDKVTKLFGNKIRIYRAPNVDGSIPEVGNFTLLQTIDIDVDSNFSQYIDSAGGSGYWYKKTYYNSANTSETSLDDALAIRGGGYGNYANWEEVREEAGLRSNKWIPANVYQEKLVMAQSEVNASLRIGGYTLPLTKVPKVVKNAVLLIAAGYVLLKEYGTENTGTNKEGNQKLELGRALLKKIEGGEGLTDDDTGVQLPTDTPGRVAGYPDSNAADTNPSQSVMFRTTDKF